MQFRDTNWAEYATLPMSAMWDDLADYFRTHKQATFCTILDTDRFPIGIVSLQEYQQRVASPFGHALNKRKSVLELMSEDFVSAALSETPETTFATMTDTAHLLNSGLVLTDDAGHYAGGLNARAVFVCLNQIHAQVLASLQAQIAEREEIERQVRNLADTDSLTGILNRRAFVREIAKLAQAEREFVCAFVDLDRFKPLNDRYGHATGDRVLVEIANRLQTNAICSLAARLGGDEYAFVTFFDSTQKALPFIEEIHEQITGSISTLAGDVAVGASVGLAAFPEDGETQSKVLHAADKAMMRCKANGGGVLRFDRNQDHFGLDAEGFEISVAKAVRRHHFRPALQPIIDLTTGAVIGHEVLARWPQSGFDIDPSPIQFIPIIERLGMMDHFFISLLQQAASLSAAGEHLLAFNISPSQLSNTRFSNVLLSELRNMQLDGERLELEVTEHVLFRNIDRSREVLTQLRAQGVSLALDDFGTGYSALSLLEELPFSKVKLDKSLLNKGGTQTCLPKVLSASIQMCKELDLISCTEGVEHAFQAELLNAQGCDQAQGYFFGRPVLSDSNAPAAAQREAS
ncbi:MAG: EAL domain-containing protein [Pseudomonadota bacterium]